MSVKAFELVPAIEREQLIGDKSSNTSIECIECCGDEFYIGASDGSVIRYRLEERKKDGKPGVVARKVCLKMLPQKKPILELRCASAMERLLVLTDNSLIVLHSDTLETLSATSGPMRLVKGVASFCVNENPAGDDPFVVFICVATMKKKSLQLFSLSQEKMTLLMEKSLPDFPLRVAWDGNFICAALVSQYVMISIDLKLNGAGSPPAGAKTQELFPLDSERVMPIVKRVAKEEFLLAGPSALGMFVTGEGISQRPPLQWSSRLTSVAFSYPYVLAMNEEFVTVHSILDYAQKQAIPFLGGVFLGDFDGKIFIASPREIYALYPVSWEKQVQDLLEDGRVDEALELAKNSRSHSTSESGTRVLNRVRLKAGFIRFRDADFLEAKQLFHEGSLDVRELISLFPLLLPTDADFTRAAPPLHEMADVSQVARGDADKLRAFTQFLLDYLEEMRPARGPHARDVNTALVKLYAEMSSTEGAAKVDSLLAEIKRNGCRETEESLDFIGCEQWLKSRELHHVTALLAQNRGHHEAAVDDWIQLVEGTLLDSSFPGLQFVIDQICAIPNVQLMMRYSEWALARDQLLGVKIFTQGSTSVAGDTDSAEETFKPSVVIKRLHNRFPKALVAYLEHVIFVRKVESEEYHTHLALTYLEHIVDMEKKNEDAAKIGEWHDKLKFLLRTSRTLRLQLLLGKMKNNKGFDHEEALLHGKIGDFSNALKIYVHRLKDVDGAENFCRDFAASSEDPDKVRRKLVAQLLQVYLDPDLSPSERDHFSAPAVRLLNQSDAFTPAGAAKILDAIPDHWSVTLLAPFLLSAVRSSLHQKRTCQIGKNIASAQRDHAQSDLARLKYGARFDLSPGLCCGVCGETLVTVSVDEDANKPKKELHRLPDGSVIHARCSRDRKTYPPRDSRMTT